MRLTHPWADFAPSNPECILDLRSLRHVVVLARRLNYTRAAEELGISQSALSRSIQAVEARAKARLFDRDRGGVHLTQLGREFADRAAALLREADELERFCGQGASGSEGRISFGVTASIAHALLPEILAEELRLRPKLRHEVAVRSTTALFDMLLQERIEFFVCAAGQLPDNAPVQSAVLGWFPVSILVRSGHPLLTSADAAKTEWPVIVSAQLGEIRAPQLAEHRLLAAKPTLLLEDHGALTRVALASDAVLLTSSFVAAEEIDRGLLHELPSPGLRYRMMLYSLDRRSLSPAAQRLRDRMKEKIASLAARFA